MATLYELAASEQALIELFESDAIDEQALNDTIEGLDIGGKLEDYCMVIRQLEADQKAYKEEADFFTVKAKRAENGVKSMKARILSYMLMTNKEKAQAGLFKISTRESKAAAIINESQIPERFLTPQPPKIDKAGIRAELLKGETVEGAALQVNKTINIK